VSATVTAPDAPPALRAPAVATCDEPTPTARSAGAVPSAPGEAPTAASVSLEAGTLRVRCHDGVEVVRPATWLRAAGDGRDAIDVVLRPCRSALTVTWRDGRRGRYTVAALRA
jgi:hypothetical protein